MNLKTTYFFITSLLFALMSSPAFSQQGRHEKCGSNIKISLDDIGKVNETRLQAIIDTTEKSLSNASHHHGRGARLSYSRPIKQHLQEYQAAMQDLHDKMYISGCKSARHEASLEARVEVLEQKLATN